MRLRTILPLAGSLAAALLAGCAGGGSAANTTPAAAAPAPLTVGFSEHGLVPDAKSFTLGIRLGGEKAVTDPTYGKILGYFKGVKSKKTHVVTIATGDTVVFQNVDSSLSHTASFLGDASASGANWPSAFNGSSTQSAAGTDISTSSFSTGALSHGAKSLAYVANVPGFYMFGCAFHYDDAGMRDVIIVK
jgi:plastocyanin